MNINRAIGTLIVPCLMIACGPGDAKQVASSDAGTAGHSGVTTGGTRATGGATTASTTTGGKAAAAGSSSAGNSSLAGNSAVGGAKSSGGATNVGGASATAGAATTTGGGTSVVTATGGGTSVVTATGGGTSVVTATGGTGTGTGGTKATGGSATSSGTGTGGAATGGAATGGTKASTGGTQATGGAVTATGGAATTCIAGNPCTGTNIPTCHSGKTTCSGTTQTCSDSGVAQNGSTCGTNMVCNNGTCTACTAGATCTSPDPCGVATVSCGLGVPQCTVTSANASQAGQACGASSGGVCTDGHCICPANTAFYLGDCSDCPSFGTSTTVYVNADASIGQDNACCGRTQNAGFGGPCRTITQALTLAQLNWTISVKGDAAGGNLSPDEVYPIHVGKGVRLNGSSACAPGVSGKNVFNVDLDTTAVSISGFTIGANCQGNGSGAKDGIYVGSTASSGSPSASVSVTITRTVNGVHVDGGTVSGGATISAVSNYGVLCRSDTIPTSLSILGNGSSFTVNQAATADIYASTNCLSGATAGGYIYANLGTTSGACPSPKQDQIGLYADSNARITLYACTIRCMNVDGITLRAGSFTTNSPQVTVSSVTLQHNGCSGAYSEVGTLRMYSSNILQNHWGVIQRSTNNSTVLTDAMVNLAGMNNTTNTANTFKCNGKAEPGACCLAGSCPNGGDVWNNSGLPLDATYNNWSAGPVATCSCDVNLQNCTCSGFANGQTTPPDGIEVLRSPYQTSSTGTVTTSNYTLASDLTCPL